MSWATLENIQLNAPSSLTIKRNVIGGYNTTLQGGQRRYIKAIKKAWVLGYDILPLSDYNNIMDAYNSLVPSGIQLSQPSLTFTITDPSLNVISEEVHMDISDANFLAGTDLLSSIQITLTQI